MRSKTIKVVLKDGSPYGVRTAEVSNRDGKLIFVPRSSLKKLKEIPEKDLPAVYFLLGEGNKIYVGETDSLSQRLSHHDREKDFWDEMIAFTSPKLSKTEVLYLEAALYKRLNDDGRADLQNGQTPQLPSIAEEDADVLDEFVDYAADALLSLGYNFIGASKDIVKSAHDGLEVVCRGGDAHGIGILSDTGLLLRSGSLVRKRETPATPASVKRIRADLVKSGKLVDSEIGGSYLLKEDHLMSSPSAASSVVLGRPSNGLMKWKTKEGITLKALEGSS